MTEDAYKLQAHICFAGGYDRWYSQALVKDTYQLFFSIPYTKKFENYKRDDMKAPE